MFGLKGIDARQALSLTFLSKPGSMTCVHELIVFYEIVKFLYSKHTDRVIK